MRKQNLLIVSEEKVRLCIVEMVCKKKRTKRSKAVHSEIYYADGSSVLLTRAIGRKACSPGRIRLVLIQFICRCVQHHQEKKSGPQRHRPLNTDYTTKYKETPPALCVIHKNDAPKASAAPETEQMWAITSELPAISLHSTPRYPLDLHDR